MSGSSRDIPEDLKSLNFENLMLFGDNNNLRIPFANDGNQNSWNSNMFQTVSPQQAPQKQLLSLAPYYGQQNDVQMSQSDYSHQNQTNFGFAGYERSYIINSSSINNQSFYPSSSSLSSSASGENCAPTAPPGSVNRNPEGNSKPKTISVVIGDDMHQFRHAI